MCVVVVVVFFFGGGGYLFVHVMVTIRVRSGVWVNISGFRRG